MPSQPEALWDLFEPSHSLLVQVLSPSATASRVDSSRWLFPDFADDDGAVHIIRLFVGLFVRRDVRTSVRVMQEFSILPWTLHLASVFLSFFASHTIARSESNGVLFLDFAVLNKDYLSFRDFCARPLLPDQFVRAWILAFGSRTRPDSPACFEKFLDSAISLFRLSWSSRVSLANVPVWLSAKLWPFA